MQQVDLIITFCSEGYGQLVTMPDKAQTQNALQLQPEWQLYGSFKLSSTAEVPHTENLQSWNVKGQH